ncbi:MAG: response regulator transcription factor [Cyclobacteriaceae bacterium]|nr:response regulator transcription factor [Cyclobacteriaceae bacterium]MCH8516946.1 response regulator transcription factor [Cyclobacteriaceae bacterium]
MQVLVVEDEEKVGRSVKRVLEDNGYKVDLAFDGIIGLKLANSKDYDVIMLDVNLPGMNGLQLCERIRANNKHTPILMVSALNSTDDIVDGLDRGANDYVVKPFQFQELLARIRVLTRYKHREFEELVYEVADLTLNSQTKEVSRADDAVKLTAKEFGILELLIRNKGRVLSKSYITEQVWGDDYDAESNVLEVYVNFLRKKLDAKHENKLIHTVVGMGYVLRDDS